MKPVARSTRRIVTAVAVVTGTVASTNENVVLDGAIAAWSGPLAEGSLLATESCHPSGGAGTLTVPLHWIALPPTTDGGEHAKLVIVGSATAVNVTELVRSP